MARACLERIGERESTVGAWIHLDPDAVLAQARELDAGAVRGPLHGLPLGVKDIIDTIDMPTAYGSGVYAGNRPAVDAAVVALARAAGALILGKTVSTEFAWFHPGKTANPRVPQNAAPCTPGGSSSGSAAAVADAMVPLAFGTQTAGSIVRPASYCGVVGYKPTYATLPRAGVKLLAESLDTPGVMARSPEDAALLVGALTGRELLREPFERAPRIALYERAVALEPKNAAACNDLGLCLARQGQLDKAVARLQQAVKLQPAKTLYRNNLATVLVEIGDPQNAYAHLAAVHPADVAHYNVGYLLAQSNQPNGAAQHFDAALKANPNLVEARQWLDSLGRTESIAAATPAPAKPQAAVPAERVTQQYDDRPRHSLPTPQPTVKQPRPLQVGERYGVSEEFSKPTAPSNERAAPQSSAVDYEALPEAATVYPATGGAGQAPTHHSEATGLRPYEARNSGWSDAPPARW